MPRRIEVFSTYFVLFTPWIPRLIESWAPFLQELVFSWDWDTGMDIEGFQDLGESLKNHQKRLFQEVVGAIRICKSIRRFEMTEAPKYLFTEPNGLFESISDKRMLSDLRIKTFGYFNVEDWDGDEAWDGQDEDDEEHRIIEGMRDCLTALDSLDSRTRRFKLSIPVVSTLSRLVKSAKTAGTPIRVVTELGEQSQMNFLFSLDSPKQEFCVFFSLFPNLNLCKFLFLASYLHPTPQMNKFPCAVVFGFIEAFQSAGGTKRVMELEISWRENARREEEIRNFLCDVSRHFGGTQLKVEGTKKRKEREIWTPAHENWMEYTLKLEKGFAVCVVMNRFVKNR